MCTDSKVDSMGPVHSQSFKGILCFFVPVNHNLIVLIVLEPTGSLTDLAKKRKQLHWYFKNFARGLEHQSRDEPVFLRSQLGVKS